MLFDVETACDRCGGAARALHRVWIERYPRALDLIFCAHHMNRYLESITDLGYEVVDVNELQPATL